MTRIELGSIDGYDHGQVQRTGEVIELEQSSRRGFLEALSVAGIGAAAANMMGGMTQQEQARVLQAREEAARAEGFAAGIQAVAGVAIETFMVTQYVNNCIIIQVRHREGKEVPPYLKHLLSYFSAKIMPGRASMSIGGVPVFIENPILPAGITPLVEGDPSSFWILYQDWQSADSTPYFRPFWPGGKDVNMTFSDKNNPEQEVELAVWNPDGPQKRLDRVCVMDPLTGHPAKGVAPVGLMRGIPQPPSVPSDLRYV
ncbi:MAG TPA: twin-arginine translocation signal domain-containing protein [Candidatus Saccharimonadales bacterium]|nr:twin-arginine translocation signal domain-containing protein [Candidatus Saccharimonadales bacterium]